jgi:hypothetical protein
MARMGGWRQQAHRHIGSLVPFFRAGQSCRKLNLLPQIPFVR